MKRVLGSLNRKCPPGGQQSQSYSCCVGLPFADTTTALRATPVRRREREEVVKLLRRSFAEWALIVPTLNIVRDRV